MQIIQNKVVAIDYELTDDKGELIDQSPDSGPLYYLHGAGQILPGLEDSLEGKSVGEKLAVTLPPEDGYGIHNPELMRAIPRDMFEQPEALEPGQQFDLEDDNGVYVFTITEVNESDVVADGNHELAGMTLTFDITVREIRDATEEELDHGHAHDPNEEPH